MMNGGEHVICEMRENGLKAEIARLRTELDAAQTEAIRLRDINGGLCRDYNSLLVRESRVCTERDAAREALEPLVKQLVEISEHESYKGIWPFLHVHGYVYTGPMYASELRNAIAALSRLSSPGAPPTKDDFWSAVRDLPRCDFCDNQIEPEWAFCPFCSGVQNEDLITERAPGAQQLAGEDGG